MKLIQEVRPFFALKVYIKVVFEKKNHPPRQNPPSTFIDFSKRFQPPRLFPPPHLVHPLHVYSNLHVYYRDESNLIIVYQKIMP